MLVEFFNNTPGFSEELVNFVTPAENLILRGNGVFQIEFSDDTTPGQALDNGLGILGMFYLTHPDYLDSNEEPVINLSVKTGYDDDDIICVMRFPIVVCGINCECAQDTQEVPDLDELTASLKDFMETFE